MFSNGTQVRSRRRRDFADVLADVMAGGLMVTCVLVLLAIGMAAVWLIVWFGTDIGRRLAG